MEDVAPVLIGVVALMWALVAVWLSVTGRARIRSCCAVPAERDLRLRDASRTAEIT